jgi:hypothetical protein
MNATLGNELKLTATLETIESNVQAELGQPLNANAQINNNLNVSISFAAPNGGSIILDDTVTETSPNAVKSSGIWAFVTNLLSNFLSSVSTSDEFTGDGTATNPLTVNSIQSNKIGYGDGTVEKMIDLLKDTLVVDLTVTQEVAAIEITKDKNNNDLLLTNKGVYCLEIFCPNGNVVNASQLMTFNNISGATDYTQGSGDRANWTHGAGTNYSMFTYFLTLIDNSASAIMHGISRAGTTNSNTNSNTMIVKPNALLADGINKINLSFNNVNARYTIGTIIKITKL